MESYNTTHEIQTPALSSGNLPAFNLVSLGYYGFEDYLQGGTQVPTENALVSSKNTAQCHPEQLGTLNLTNNAIILPKQNVTSEKIIKTPKCIGKNKSDRLKCPECGKSFRRASMVTHLRTHTGERPYECKECGMKFAAKTNLRTHSRLHTGEKPYMCGICGKTFVQSSHLVGHAARVHRKERNYKCTKCDMSFISKMQFKFHLMKHIGDFPFKCHFCDKNFTNKVACQDHQKSHSKKKPFKCDVCRKFFKTKSYVDKHKRLFCLKDGYKSRWKAPGVQLPPGRKPKGNRKGKIKGGLDKPKRPRGRPKKRNKSKEKCINKDDSLDEALNNDLVEIDEPFDASLSEPLALTLESSEKNFLVPHSSVETIKSLNFSSQSGEINYSDCSIHVNSAQGIGLDSMHDNIANYSLAHSKPMTDSPSFPLDLVLCEQHAILNFPEPQNLTIHHTFSQTQNLTESHNNIIDFSQPQNLTHQANSLNLSYSHEEPSSYSQPENLSCHSSINSHFTPHILDCTQQSMTFSQPEDLSHSKNSLENYFSQPQNLTLPQNNLNNINSNFSQPQNLCVPQNLSIHQNIPQSLGQPQNLTHSILHDQSTSQSILAETLLQPQNLSLPQKFHTQILNMQTHQPENLSLPQNLSMSEELAPSHALMEPQNLSQTQNISQPQNLSLISNSLNNSNRIPHSQSENLPQPKNLSQSKNLSYSTNFEHALHSMAHNLSQPQNLSLSHNGQLTQELNQPQNLTYQQPHSSEPYNLSHSHHIDHSHLEQSFVNFKPLHSEHNLSNIDHNLFWPSNQMVTKHE